MRFKLILEVDKNAFGNVLPINYQYEQSAAIYKLLSKSNTQYSQWLHDNGFQLENGKCFKLFTFSRFKIEKREVLQQEERIIILSDTIEWQISFLPEKSTGNFIQGIFSNEIFQIGDKKSVVQFRIKSIEALQMPEFKSEMIFESMSPICIRSNSQDGKIDYISPLDFRAKGAILVGLMSRYQAFYNKPYQGDLNFDFSVLTEPKSVLIKMKSDTPAQTKVRGYMCRFKIKVSAELMRIMYESGIGEETAQGFGCVREVKIKKVPQISL
ncbi:MAG: CRISPR-associated endoribonuclease Cas6 [Bacteroidales bacterium]